MVELTEQDFFVHELQNGVFSLQIIIKDQGTPIAEINDIKSHIFSCQRKTKDYYQLSKYIDDIKVRGGLRGTEFTTMQQERKIVEALKDWNDEVEKPVEEGYLPLISIGGLRARLKEILEIE